MSLHQAVFALAALLLLGSLAMFRRTRTFIARCRAAEGRIVSYTRDDSTEGGIFYFYVIRFRDASGVEHDIPGPHGLQEPPVVGTTVAITYDPSYPTNAWITGSAAPWVLPWIVLLAGIAAVIAGFVVRAEG